MTDNADTRGTDEPESGAEGVGEDGKRNGDDQQTGVELRSSGAESANLNITTLEFANTVHTTNNEENDESQEPVGDQGVDAQHDEEDSIVAGEVAKVVVDTVLNFAEVLRLGDLLEVEELGDGFQIGEAGADGLGANIVKATLEVETRCNGIERKVDWHFDESWYSRGSQRFGRVDEGEGCLEVESKRGSQPESTEFLCLHVKTAASVVEREAADSTVQSGKDSLVGIRGRENDWRVSGRRAEVQQENNKGVM